MSTGSRDGGTLPERPAMQLFQPMMTTLLFRNMPLLQLAREALTNRPPHELRILSFGCSRGDELVTLRLLFPQAQIFGCDIQPAALAAAAAISHIAEAFPSDLDEIRRRGPYDLVVALSSLCRYPEPETPVMKQEFPFTVFEDTLGNLVDTVAPGGYIGLYNTSYPVRLTEAGTRLSPLRSTRLPLNGFCSVYNPAGNLLLKQDRTSFETYHRLVEVGPLVDEDLYDGLFCNGPPPAIDLPEPNMDGWTLVANWTRDHLQNLSENGRAHCLAKSTHYEGYVGPNPGDCRILSQVEQSTLSRDGTITTGPFLTMP